jgi:hypothetical protein
MADSGTAGGLAAVPRQPMDTAAYEKRSHEGPSFVCETLAGNPDHPGHFIWADDLAVPFLARYNTLPLPPGVPYQEQQLAAFLYERGVLVFPDEDMAELARRIGHRVEHMHQAE